MPASDYTPPYLYFVAPLEDLAASNPVIWRQEIEDRATEALADLGLTSTGGGTGLGTTDASFGTTDANLEAAYARLGAFLADEASVPDDSVVGVLLPDGSQRSTSVGALRAQA